MEEAQEIIQKLREQANPQKAVEMKAYMRNKFNFFGISSPARRAIFQPFFAALDKHEHPKNAFVITCYEQEQRECQYLAMEYVYRFRKNLKKEDHALVRYMNMEKSWWDTVDYIAAKILGAMVLKYPGIKDEVITAWASDENMWLRRSALLAQLKFKESTDVKFLSYTIRENLGDSEFFINKAIGWALREYSKTNPDWVRNFLQDHELQPLSFREASKYI